LCHETGPASAARLAGPARRR